MIDDEFIKIREWCRPIGISKDSAYKGRDSVGRLFRVNWPALALLPPEGALTWRGFPVIGSDPTKTRSTTSWRELDLRPSDPTSSATRSIY